jgi:hypothetical protein
MSLIKSIHDAIEDARHRSPRIIQRRCGGWLALSCQCEPIKIGVTAETENAACEQFHAAINEWRREMRSQLKPPLVYMTESERKESERITREIHADARAAVERQRRTSGHGGDEK